MGNYILQGGRAIDPANSIDEITDIGIKEDKIVKPEDVPNPTVIDVRGCVVAPGFIDMHVHLRHPGQSKKETVTSGTRAAAAGGFTAVVSMPNTSPAADTPATIELIKRHIELESVVKVYPCGAMTKNVEGKEMAGIGALKKAGIIAISDDGNCIQDHDLMRHVVEYAKSFSLPVLDHCEDKALAKDGVMHEGKWSTLLGMRAIPAEAEEIMVYRDIILARKIGWKIHIQHISSVHSVEAVRKAKKEGILVSAEVTPHHISLTDEEIKHFDTNFKMNPPLRSPQDIEALIEGLKDNTITVIATDHAPHTPTEKLVEFDYAPFGIIGLETALPVCLTELYHKGHLSLSQLISKFTIGPAEVLGLPTPSLEEGATADITVFNPEEEFVLDTNRFYSKASNTPFNGKKVKGKVSATFVNGSFVYGNTHEYTGFFPK